MTVSRTTVGGYFVAAGFALGAAAAKLPADVFPKSGYVLAALAAGIGGFGAVLFGTNSTDTKDAITKDQFRALPHDHSVLVGDMIQHEPPAVVKTDPPATEPPPHALDDPHRP